MHASIPFWQIIHWIRAPNIANGENNRMPFISGLKFVWPRETNLLNTIHLSWMSLQSLFFNFMIMDSRHSYPNKFLVLRVQCVFHSHNTWICIIQVVTLHSSAATPTCSNPKGVGGINAVGHFDPDSLTQEVTCKLVSDTDLFRGGNHVPHQIAQICPYKEG